MENCEITLQDEDGLIAEISAKDIGLIKVMIANGCTVIRIHRPGYCTLPRK